MDKSRQDSGDVTAALSRAATTIEEPPPVRIGGRYPVRRGLGAGGYGTVYEAYDERMQRPVAIKVPNSKLVTAHARAAFLREARAAAQLRHENIVTVHDFAEEPGGRVFIVYEFVDGTTLAQRARAGRIPHAEVAQIIAQVAGALHYAHLQGLIHRDVKPSNILLDRQGRPRVTDFGLAVREDELTECRDHAAGTWSYLSPEQVRGEGHRIDGRTDIYSLGVTLYQLLTGRLPFVAETRDDLFDQILHREAKPPRQSDDTIPRELERICLKAMSKRVAERYSAAKDFADELRLAVASSPAVLASAAITVAPAVKTHEATPRVVPKGLKSFGPEDSDFFWELLPGPRDREGLPDSIRFWKTRIESTEVEAACPVGLMYGPSGCGKSSLLKAGVLPRLASEVSTAYVECTAHDTEVRLQRALHRLLPRLKSSGSLSEMLAAIRRGDGVRAGHKVLIVLDQFEQWLHSDGERSRPSDLVPALRQCDGVHLQCIVTVRDDFWLGISRFFQELEIPLVEGQNFHLVDLFAPRHAHHVLKLFGQAYGCLPANVGDMSAEQMAFLDLVVESLSQGEKVIPIRLSLFADMMKSRDWTPRSFRAVGGAEGVGITFLEETFSTRSANPHYRAQEGPARAMLQALLPDAESDIKGRMRSRDELASASGLPGDPTRFAQVLHILDRELHLITPTEEEASETGIQDSTRTSPDGAARSEPNSSTLHPEHRTPKPAFYQLTHDYLVPSLREWLTSKRRETWYGRKQLCLEERTAQWVGSRVSRFLPNPLEYVTILAAVPGKHWKPQQRALMRAAGFRYGIGFVILLLVAIASAWGGWELNQRMRADGLIRAISNASTDQVPGLVAQLEPYRRWATRPLRELRSDSGNPQAQLHAALALLPADPVQVSYLRERLLDCSIQRLSVLRDSLLPHASELSSDLWQLATDETADSSRRFNAVLALATYDPNGAAWNEDVVQFVVDRLLASSVDFQREYRAALQPVRTHLVNAVAAVAADSRRDATARILATNALVDFARDEPRLLIDALLRSDGRQFPIVLESLRSRRDQTLDLLSHRDSATAERLRPEGGGTTESTLDQVASRDALASIALLHLGERTQAWQVLVHEGDPRTRTYWIHHVQTMALPPVVLADRLLATDDSREKFALLQTLGEYEPRTCGESTRRQIVEHTASLYRDSPRRDLHAASEWLLRRWGQNDIVDELDHNRIARPGPADSFEWFMNGQGMTMVVVPPGEFWMGSTASDPAHGSDETRHRVKITRPFAISDREVTVEQFFKFFREVYKRDFDDVEEWSPRGENGPVVAVSWFMAVAYCRWLSDQEGIEPDRNCYPPLEVILAAERRADAGERVTLDFAADFAARPGYRLPTEAEWEYACRAGTVTPYSFGSDPELLGRYGWFSRNSKRHGSRQRTWPGGLLKPNDWGLFDMHGNVWEWCHDWYDSEYTEAEATDPTGPALGQSRVRRGGGWFYEAWLCRAPLRYFLSPSERSASNGFRVVCSPLRPR